MALQSSGQISLNDIHVEAGGTSGSQASINDSDIRALIGKSSGASMSFSEWYGASAETVLHSTSFQPQKATHQFPYQPLYHFSGFRGTKGLYPGNTYFGSINSEGSFALGGKTGVAIGLIYNYNITNDSTNGTKIRITFHATSTSNFANSGWTKLELYASSDGSGSVLLTLNRADGSFSATGTNSSYGRVAQYEWSATRAFSTFFGTSTTASSNTTHFIKIIE